MKYFAKITQDHWTLKNKVNKEARQVAKEMENTLIPNEKVLGQWLARLSDRIHQVNKANPRCTPLVMHMHGESLGGIKAGKIAYAYIDGNFTISIFPVKYEL